VAAGKPPRAAGAGRGELAALARAGGLCVMVLHPGDQQHITYIYIVTSNTRPGSSSKTSRGLEIKDSFHSQAFPSYPLGVFDCILQTE